MNPCADELDPRQPAPALAGLLQTTHLVDEAAYGRTMDEAARDALLTGIFNTGPQCVGSRRRLFERRALLAAIDEHLSGVSLKRINYISSTG